jgi:3-oxo-5-alpha-steroid 4-dehydrogenase 1
MEWIIYSAYIWMAVGAIAFFYLLSKTAPFGRHTTSSWGKMMDNRAGWIIMEVVSPIVFNLTFFSQGISLDSLQWVLIACWNIHYVNRSLIFPFRIRTKGKKMPIIIALSAVGFNIVNGFFNGYFLAHFAPSFGVLFFIGVVLFIGGFLINNWADTKLINLRKPGELGYKIPTGGLFSFISCPNLFGEIVEWIGFALMAQNLGATSFAVWTVANLFPRALDHHKWYKQRFDDYPAERKAVIPFII